MKEPVHDTVALRLNDSGRVLIFGGNCDGLPNRKFQVYDLSCELHPLLMNDQHQTKIYLPPVLQDSTLHYFQGYGDA
jgi:hypothetical protein